MNENYYDKWVELFNTLIEESTDCAPSDKKHINSFIKQLEKIYPSKEELILTCDIEKDKDYSHLLEKLEDLLSRKTGLGEWKDFFVSDEFLDVQFDVEWGRALWECLSSSERLYNLPPNFLIQLALSYGLLIDYDYNFYDNHLKRIIQLIFALQRPVVQRNLFYSLFSSKIKSSSITHGIYLGLLFTYYAEANDDWKTTTYGNYLMHIHYAVYPVVLIDREKEVITLVSYFIRKFKALYRGNLEQLILNFNLTNIDNTINKTLYKPLYQAILDAGFDVEESKHERDEEVFFLKTLLPATFKQNVEKEVVNEFFNHPYFVNKSRTTNLIYELRYELTQEVMISYYFWKRLYTYFNAIVLEEEENSEIRHAAIEICDVLTSSDFTNYLKYSDNEDSNDSVQPQLIDSMLNTANPVPEKVREQWLRRHIFFNNLNVDTTTPMRTIYHSILLELLRSLDDKSGFSYDMESDGRYIIAYKEGTVIVVFEIVKYKGSKRQVTFKEAAIFGISDYITILEDVVNIYLDKYFNTSSVRKGFLDLLEKVKLKNID